ncbi:MAG: hypothetical protein ACFFCS_10295 [Candidatus Hodarchaeota archaeon]
MNIQLSLTPSESKRLIAKGVLEFLKDRIENKKKIILTRGSTNAFILDEIYKHLGIEKEFNKADFITGEIIPGENGLWANKKRIPEIFVKGTKITEIESKEQRLQLVSQMRFGDVLIKGGNAIDSNGTVGVLVGDPSGGTVGALYGIVKAKGIDLVIPIGLEKMIFGDINFISDIAGQNACKHSRGLACGLFPISGIVITEIEALELLFDVEAFQMGSGGLGDAQGSVALLIESDDKEELNKCWDFLSEEIFGEEKLEPNPME